jgi:hypothetical protein
MEGWNGWKVAMDSVDGDSVLTWVIGEAARDLAAELGSFALLSSVNACTCSLGGATILSTRSALGAVGMAASWARGAIGGTLVREEGLAGEI